MVYGAGLLDQTQNSESKKEEFRKYLERAGVIDALTKGAPRRRRCDSQKLRWPAARPPAPATAAATARVTGGRGCVEALLAEPDSPAASRWPLRRRATFFF